MSDNLKRPLFGGIAGTGDTETSTVPRRRKAWQPPRVIVGVGALQTDFPSGNASDGPNNSHNVS